MGHSRKFFENAAAIVQMKRLGWTTGTILIHKSTSTVVVLGLADDMGRYWAMTKSSNPKKGKLRPAEIIAQYMESGPAPAIPSSPAIRAGEGVANGRV